MGSSRYTCIRRADRKAQFITSTNACVWLARPERRDNHQVPSARDVPAQIKATTEPTVVQILTLRFDTFWPRAPQEYDISLPNLPLILRSEPDHDSVGGIRPQF